MMATNIISSSLTNTEIARYGRQLILPQIGKSGQELIKAAKVLIVGCGGLGCPSSQYLVSAGIGTIGLLDNDTISINNLHRQILYNESNVDVHKVDQSVNMLSQLNKNVTFVSHKVTLSSVNAMDIFRGYDLILDCTDNPASRYLINDCCVLLGKPYIFGAALRTDGQVSTYNFKGGPCYRCINPAPKIIENTDNCSDAGVIGPLTGIVGSVQATEALRIISKGTSSYSGKLFVCNPWEGIYRVVKLRKKQSSCQVCGENPSVTELKDVTYNCPIALISCSREDRITVEEYADTFNDHVTLDVRPAVEFDLCRLTNSINTPIQDIQNDKVDIQLPKTNKTVYVLCRRGNDSQHAVKLLKGRFTDNEFKDVIGGLQSWTEKIDPNFPTY